MLFDVEVCGNALLNTFSNLNKKPQIIIRIGIVIVLHGFVVLGEITIL